MTLLKRAWRWICALVKRKNMARVKVPFLGMTTRSNHLDGECVTIVNARPKNGAWRPVAPRKVVATLGDTYDIIFVHRGSGYENWIGTKGKAIYTNVKTTAVHLATVGENVNSVQQVGNTLCFVTANGVYYALFMNGAYKYLGQIPELPDVKFTISQTFEGKKTYVAEYGSPPLRLAEDMVGQMKDLTIGLAKKIVEENKDKFHDAFFIRWAFRIYDGSVIKHSAPILILMMDRYTEAGLAYLPDGTGNNYGDASEVMLKFFTLSAIYDFSQLENWGDIIKSVDFFITPPVGLASPENVKNYFWRRGSGDNVYNIYYPNFRGAEDHQKTAYEKVLNNYLFYHYYSETKFNGQKTVTFPNADTTIGNQWENIVFQEPMPVDTLSNHRHGALKATTYNNRIRLAGMRTVFYRGHPAKNFNPDHTMNGYESPYPQASKSVILVVHLSTSEGIKYVKSESHVGSCYLRPFISYPDPRAFKIEVITVNPGNPNHPYTHVHTIPLSPHKHLNIAYYLNEGLNPIVFPSENQTSPAFVPPSAPCEYNTMLEPNKLKVSEVNNPFVFPNETTYQVGVGTILNESSIVMNVADRNYGIYPVFVFTTDGVFTMAGQHGEAVHASIQAPTYMEPPINDVICPTPHGVAFITKRGLMLINQYKTESVSEQLREEGDKLSVTVNDIELPMLDYPGETFEDYLEGVTVMVYNQHEDELIVVNPEKPYNYVYDFRAKGFYLSTEVIDKAVQNVFPEVLVVGGTSMKDYKYPDQVGAVVPWQKVAIVTRPLRFVTTDKKKLDRAYFRGLLRGVAPVAEHGNTMIILFYSQDGVNFSPVRGMILREGFSYKDFDFGLMARTKWNYYMFAIAGTIASDSNLDYVEFEIAKEYQNEKMR